MIRSLRHRDVDREHALSCCARCCASAASRRSAPSSTAPARSAASCTSTSARRRSRSARCRRSSPTTPSSPPTASTAMRWRAACRRARSWPRCTASAKAAAAAAAARCTCSTPRTRFYGGNAIVGGGLPLAVGLALADKMQERPRVTACFFGDGAVAEGEFHESHEPRRAVEAAGAVLLREQPLRDGHRARARSESRDRPRRSRRAATACRAAGGRHGRRSPSRPRRARAATAVRAGGGPVLPRVPHLPLPRALDVRPGAVPRQGARSRSGRQRDPIATVQRAAARSRACWTTTIWQRSKARSPRRSTQAVAFAEAGRWEPVEDLTRFVYVGGARR